jgi:hypothetical protein
MSWYTVGQEAADALAASQSQFRRTKNFFTRQDQGESAVIRFLSPAKDSFNYKRAFVKWAKGQKTFTSPQTVPDPFVEAGLQLQAAFAWKVIDRRVIEFDDKTTGEKKKIGPRVLYFADGQRTRKQLLAFEKQILEDENEARAEDGKDPLGLQDFNLTSYDLTVKKEKGAPWIFTAKRPRKLSKEDQELVEKNDFDLKEELAPLETPVLKALLGSPESVVEEKETETSYSYEDDGDDTIKFSDD